MIGGSPPDLVVRQSPMIWKVIALAMNTVRKTLLGQSEEMGGFRPVSTERPAFRALAAGGNDVSSEMVGVS
ncbi:MAG TPA: hypothetical protein VG188_12395 [Solirubrobacteraceae bacterium]|jgi:hypothetical protein|nr:hypothetical protein [Solirubrobacteraceae bacterium]